MSDPDLQQKRLIAAAIDGLLLTLLIGISSVVLGLLGFAVSMADIGGVGMQLGSLLLATLSALYVLGRDVLAGGRSVGKQLMNVRLTTTAGTSAGILESVKRNSLFAPPFLLWVLTVFIGMLPLGTCVACLMLPLQLLAGAAALVATIWELMLILQEPDGIRFGDTLAGTRVVR